MAKPSLADLFEGAFAELQNFIGEPDSFVTQRFESGSFLGRSGLSPDELDSLLEDETPVDPRPEGPWICGGFFRRILLNQKRDSDVDYFFKNPKQLKQFLLDATSGGWEETARSDTAITLKKGGRVAQASIIHYYASIEAVLNSFDFTITQVGFDGKDLVFGPYTLWDIARKRLALHRLTYGVSTLRRLIKYSRQGFTACGGVMADILQQVVNDPQTINHEVVSLG